GAYAKKAVTDLFNGTQKGFTDLGNSIIKMSDDIVKLQDATKKPVAPVATKGAAAGPVVAGPDEYVVKSLDSGTKIATAHGVTFAELQAVNPGVDWKLLKPGQKLKLPAKK
ncbi:MAG: LysM domain-containing protein, partial [Opitutaceae bacterium]